MNFSLLSFQDVSPSSSDLIYLCNLSHGISCSIRLSAFLFLILLTRIIHQPQKPTKDGTLGSRMILKTASHRRIIILKQAQQVVLALYKSVSSSQSGTMRPGSPRRLTTSSSHVGPRRSPRRCTGPARSHARTPTKSRCASKPTPPGTTRVTKS